MNPTATISISPDDFAYIKDKHLSPSKLFRQAMYQHRAGKLELEEVSLGSLIDEIVKLRNVVSAQNMAARQDMKSIRELEAEVLKLKEGNR